MLNKWPRKSEPEEPQPNFSKNSIVDDCAPIDVASLVSIVGNDRDKLCHLMHLFVDSTGGIIEEIHAALQDYSAEKIRQQAHKLKSSAGSMGAQTLADACEELEAACKEDQWDKISELVSQCDALFTPVDTYVKSYCAPQEIRSATRVGEAVKELSILLLNDDSFMLNLEEMMLNELGIKNISVAMTGEDALAIVDDGNSCVQLIMCDLKMPDMDGIEFLRLLAQGNYAGMIMLVSGEDERILLAAERIAAAHRLNVLGVLEKPFSRTEVIRVLSRIKMEQVPPR